MPARDPSAAPMAHLVTSTTHRHPKPHHLESGLGGGGPAQGGRRGSFPASALFSSTTERPPVPPSSIKSADDGLTQHTTSALDPDAPRDASGRSASISGLPSFEPTHDPRRKSLWQSISSITTVSQDARRRRSSDELPLDPGASGVLSNGSAGGSGWFSGRGDTTSVYSAGGDDS